VAKTLGYGPPEMDTGHVSPKSDMYSYGVVRAVKEWCVYNTTETGLGLILGSLKFGLSNWECTVHVGRVKSPFS